MSTALTLVLAWVVAAAAAWLAGMIVPALVKGRLAPCSALALLLPGAALMLDLPLYRVGIEGEQSAGFALLALGGLFIGLIALTLALLARSRHHAFGSVE